MIRTEGAAFNETHGSSTRQKSILITCCSSFDIGFGIFFEWSQNGNDSRVTIHVSESDEEDEDLDGEGLEGGTAG